MKQATKLAAAVERPRKLSWLGADAGELGG